MRAVLDTNILLTGVAVPSMYTELRVSSLTWAEIGTGIGKARGIGEVKVAREREHQLTAWRDVYGPGLPFSDTGAANFRLLVELTHAAGRESRRRIVDLMIAATAMEHGAALITSNPGDFRGFTGILNVVEP